jgi:hypothetical protein
MLATIYEESECTCYEMPYDIINDGKISENYEIINCKYCGDTYEDKEEAFFTQFLNILNYGFM